MSDNPFLRDTHQSDIQSGIPRPDEEMKSHYCTGKHSCVKDNAGCCQLQLRHRFRCTANQESGHKSGKMPFSNGQAARFPFCKEEYTCKNLTEFLYHCLKELIYHIDFLLKI